MASIVADDDSGDEFGSVEDDDLLLAEAKPSTLGSKRSRSTELDAEIKPKKLCANDDPKALTLAKQILQQTWGFSDFRLKQQTAIVRLIEGGNAVVIFPTGGGKSFVYQVPALAFGEYDKLCGQKPSGGVTLVVSPLIALMKDQVDALKKRGVAAAALDSTQSRESFLDTHEKLRTGKLKLLYVAPERLNNEGFVQMISSTLVRLIAIDEAHCISQWGHAFRPDYLKVARFAKEIRAERVLCLTATATTQVADDICAAFNIDKDAVFRTPSYRSSLQLLIESHNSHEAKESALKSFLRANKGPSIVYVQTHSQSEALRESLSKAKFNAYHYHAGMTNEARTAVQDRFLTSKDIIIVATIAFGMGIDKADIRNVVHFTIPKSFEGYSQEIGRAGRDGLPSTCLLYLCGEDLALLEQWCRADVPSPNSIQGLVGDMIETHRNAKVGDIIERNLSDESQEWDIQRSTLDNLNAQLELRFELIRNITPKYSQYKYAESDNFDLVDADNSKVAKGLRKASKTAKKWTTVDVDSAAKLEGFNRGDAVRKLQEWSNNGAIELQPSGVINRFRILKEFPQNQMAKDTIVANIYRRIKERERDELERIQYVIGLITARACISRGLAMHFGDQQSVPLTGCGHCSYCHTKRGVSFSRDQKWDRKGRISESAIKAILKTTDIRDDPHFLARVAFGVRSPRVTKEKLSKHEVFGSMENCDFEELVEKFEKICRSPQNTDLTPTSKPSQARKSSQTSKPSYTGKSSYADKPRYTGGSSYARRPSYLKDYPRSKYKRGLRR